MWKKVRTALCWPLLIVIAAFTLRMIIIYSREISAPVPLVVQTPYGYETGHIAAAIASGRGFSSPLNVASGPTAWLTPVYPYMVAAVFRLFGIYSYSSVLVITSLNCVFSALTCWPIFLIARRLFGRGVAAWSAWLWVFFPTAIKYPIEWVWDTSLSALLLALIFLATLKVAESGRARDWSGYGLLWALGAMTNPALVSLLPFFGGWALFRMKAHSQRWLNLAALSSLAFFLACLPWSVRNYRVFGQVVPFRSNFGLELWLGNNDLVPDDLTPELHPAGNEIEGAKYMRMGEIAYMAEKKHLALQYIRTHPRDFAGFLAFRFMNTWTGAWGSPVQLLFHGTWKGRAALVQSCLFSLLAFAGVLFASRSRVAAATPFASALLVFPIIYYLTHTSLRYRHPIDPLMAILVVYAVARLAALVARSPLGAASHSGAPILGGDSHIR